MMNAIFKVWRAAMIQPLGCIITMLCTTGMIAVAISLAAWLYHHALKAFS